MTTVTQPHSSTLVALTTAVVQVQNSVFLSPSATILMGGIFFLADVGNNHGLGLVRLINHLFGSNILNCMVFAVYIFFSKKKIHLSCRPKQAFRQSTGTKSEKNATGDRHR